MRVLLLGTRKLGYMGMEAIHASKHKLVGVVTHDYDITEGYDSAKYAEFCAKNKIAFYGNERANQDTRVLDAAYVSDIGVSLYWRRLIRGLLVIAPKHGFINVHGSDLPKYRGFAATSWAILRGDEMAGVTVHKVVDGVADNGDIYAKALVPITSTTTVRTLQEQIWTLAIPMVLKTLDNIEDGRAVPMPQEALGAAVNTYPRLPRDGEIDWKLPAIAIDQLVRAVTQPYPGAYTFFQDADGAIRKLIIWRAHTISPLDFGCAKMVGVPGHVIGHNRKEGWSAVLSGKGVLALDSVEIEGGDGVFQPGQVWKGTQIRLGLAVQDEVAGLRQRVAELERRLEMLTYCEDK